MTRDHASALAAQRRALSLVPSDADRADMERRLAEYEAVAVGLEGR